MSIIEGLKFVIEKELSNREIKLFIFLCEKGRQHIIKLAEEMECSKENLYHILRLLKAKGMIKEDGQDPEHKKLIMWIANENFF